MKGPSLHYDLRVLRIFCCDGCGRRVQTRGNVTSHTCPCSDPPRFMRPLDRPKTVSPDVSAFISPPDPDELIEEEIIDETPHVPHVPQKPPTPARFANRRKLYDEAAPGPESDSHDDSGPNDELNFGEGIDQDLPERPAAELPTASKPHNTGERETRRADSNRNTDGKNSRRRRGGRTGSEQRTNTPRENPTTASESSTAQPQQALPPSSDSTAAGESGSDAANSESSDNAASTEAGGSPRRRSRRRGRRRGPRPEGAGE